MDILSQFDLQIELVPGKQSTVADALSRRADLVATVEVQSELLHRIRSSQQSAVGSEVWDSLKADAVLGKRNLVMLDGLVCQRSDIARAKVIPDDTDLKQSLMKQYHDSPTSDHLGAYRIIGSLLSRYYWHGLYNDVKEYCKKCLTCQASKDGTQASVGQLQPLPTQTYNFEHVTIDLITHLPTTDAGYDSIYTVVYRLSKYVYFLPCNATVSADNLAQLFLANVVRRHGMPRRIISDRDPQFASRFWTQLTTALGCQQALSTVYHPEMGGQSERFHHCIK